MIMRKCLILLLNKILTIFYKKFVYYVYYGCLNLMKANYFSLSHKCLIICLILINFNFYKHSQKVFFMVYKEY